MRKDQCFASERLTYKGMTEEDASLVVKWRSEPENYQWFFIKKPITLESHLAWFRGYLDDDTRFDFMILDSEGEPIGTCGLSRITEESCEVSYMIGNTNARGKGYASEAVRAMCSVAFAELGVMRVEARIAPGNDASIHTALSAGLTEQERVFAIERHA